MPLTFYISRSPNISAPLLAQLLSCAWVMETTGSSTRNFGIALPHGIAGCRFMMVRSMFDAGRSCIQEEVNPSLGLSKLFVHPGCVMIPASDLGRFGRSQYLCSSSRPGKCVFRPQPAIHGLNRSRSRDRRTCLDIDFFFSQMSMFTFLNVRFLHLIN